MTALQTRARSEARGSGWLTVALLLLLIGCLHGWHAVTGDAPQTSDRIVVAEADHPGPAQPAPETHHRDAPFSTAGTCLLLMIAVLGAVALLSACQWRRLSSALGRLTIGYLTHRQMPVSLAQLCILRT